MRYWSIISALVPALALVSVGCRSTTQDIPVVRSELRPDKHRACKVAIAHYGADDLAGSEILEMFEQLSPQHNYVARQMCAGDFRRAYRPKCVWQWLGYAFAAHGSISLGSRV